MFRKGHKGYWKGKKRPPLSKEWCRKLSIANKGRKNPPRTEEHRRKISERMKKNNPMNNPKTKEKIIEFRRNFYNEKDKKGKSINAPMYNKHHTEETKEMIRQKHKGKHFSPKTEFKKGYNKGKKLSKKAKEKVSKAQKKLWKNEEYAKKAFKKFAIKPNKPEKQMIELLKKNFPNQFRYIGDGKFWIEGFCPDFICNPSKKIIEVFGDYWHDGEDVKKRDEKRLQAYSKYGFSTLVIWEHELTGRGYGEKLTEQEIINKIRSFIKI